jgi:hypothetical protein
LLVLILVFSTNTTVATSFGRQWLDFACTTRQTRLFLNRWLVIPLWAIFTRGLLVLVRILADHTFFARGRTHHVLIPTFQTMFTSGLLILIGVLAKRTWFAIGYTLLVLVVAFGTGGAIVIASSLFVFATHTFGTTTVRPLLTRGIASRVVRRSFVARSASDVS